MNGITGYSMAEHIYVFLTRPGVTLSYLVEWEAYLRRASRLVRLTEWDAHLHHASMEGDKRT